MTTSELKALEYVIDEIKEIAMGLGLDFYSLTSTYLYSEGNFQFKKFTAASK